MKKFGSTALLVTLTCLLLTACSGSGDNVNDLSNSKESMPASSVEESSSVQSSEVQLSSEESIVIDPDKESDANSQRATEESSQEVSDKEQQLASNQDIANEKFQKALDLYIDVMSETNTLEKHIMYDMISSFSWADWAWFQEDHTCHTVTGLVNDYNENILYSDSLYNGLCLFFYNRVNGINNEFYVADWYRANHNTYTKDYFPGVHEKDIWGQRQNDAPFFSFLILGEYLYQHEVSIGDLREEHYEMLTGGNTDKYVAEYACDVFVDGNSGVLLARYDKDMNFLGVNFVGGGQACADWEDLPKPAWKADEIK